MGDPYRNFARSLDLSTIFIINLHFCLGSPMPHRILRQFYNFICERSEKWMIPIEIPPVIWISQ